MRLKVTSVVIISLFFILLKCGAQNNNFNTNLSINIPEVALLSLKSFSSEVVNLSPQLRGEAGMAIDFSPTRNNDIWVNYSSISNGNNSKRHLDAIINGDIPEGIRLKLLASADAGHGGGQVGLPTGEIVLSGNQQEIISGIGSCYTSVGVNNGHRLTYFLEADEEGLYSSLQNNTVNLTVTFTLSDGE